ncbi:MAG: glycoside hydrolase family 32 protein [Anaerolineales bacterium]|nr:glycoside hydrolase family 32 protein [Anaerolineales bacterium]
MIVNAPDRRQPRFHFRPAQNWMNDPNGLIQWQGQYHLFYQYNPAGPYHARIHWGHAVSRDLVHWEHWPVALTPTPGGPDQDGCWSGCAVDNAGVPTLIYTGVHPQVVCLATSADGLRRWDKHPASPVIAGPPPEIAAGTGGHFRDPFVWREAGQWHMVIGSQAAGRGGLVLHYRSPDLLRWEYLGPLLAGDATQAEPVWTAAMWECPNFFALDGQHLLFFSAQTAPGELLYPVYYAGAFDGQRFQPRAQGILVHGQSFYAPLALRLDDGRLVVWGWLKEARSEAAQRAAGWSGALSLPMTLGLTPAGELRIEPVAELQALRQAPRHFAELALSPGRAGWLDGLHGDCLEIEAVFEASPEAEFGLQLLAAPDGQEQTRLIYAGRTQRLSLEADQASLSPDVDRGVRRAPLSLAGGALRLRVFVDRSVIEVFANGRLCLAGRVYPTRPDSLGVDLLVRQGPVRLKSLTAWPLSAIWER